MAVKHHHRKQDSQEEFLLSGEQSGQKCGVYSFYCSGDWLGAHLCPNMIGRVLIDIHFWQTFMNSWRMCIAHSRHMTVFPLQFHHFITPDRCVFSCLTQHCWKLHKLWKLRILRFHRGRQEKGSLDDGILPPSSINYSIYKLRFDTITWASCSCHLAVYERLMSRCWTVETIIVFFLSFLLSFLLLLFISQWPFFVCFVKGYFLWRNVLFTMMKQSFTVFFKLKPITMPSLFFFLSVKFPSHSELN